MHHKKLPSRQNELMDYKETMGGQAEKASIIKGKVRMMGEVSHGRGSKFSQGEDQAQEHAVGYHRGGCAHNHIELVTR